MAIKFIQLNLKNSTSDKVYRIEINQIGNDFTVDFAYGRRGNALNAGTKTSTPVTLSRAESIYQTLVNEKRAKGYDLPEHFGLPAIPGNGRAGNSTFVPVAAPTTDPSLFLPQLLCATDNLERFLADHSFVAQEKFDGERRLAEVSQGQALGINKKGLYVPLPTVIEADLLSLKAEFVLDGEQVGERLHVFDLLSLNNRDVRNSPYSQRWDLLEMLVTELPNVKLVRLIHGEAAKREFYAELIASGREGIVFKDPRDPYVAGKGNQFKFKFYKTIHCIVTAHNEQRSVQVGLLQNGQVVPAGNVTVPPNQTIPHRQSVIEVRYLYAHRNSGILYQPTLLAQRTDVSHAECGISQLQFKDSPTP